MWPIVKSVYLSLSPCFLCASPRVHIDVLSAPHNQLRHKVEGRENSNIFGPLSTYGADQVGIIPSKSLLPHTTDTGIHIVVFPLPSEQDRPILPELPPHSLHHKMSQ